MLGLKGEAGTLKMYTSGGIYMKAMKRGLCLALQLEVTFTQHKQSSHSQSHQSQSLMPQVVNPKPVPAAIFGYTIANPICHSWLYHSQSQLLYHSQPSGSITR